MSLIQRTSCTTLCGDVRLVAATEHDPLLGLALTLGVGALRLSLDESFGLVEGNAQRLGTHGRSTGINLLALDLTRTEFLDLVLAVGDQAVGNDTGVLCVEGRDKVLPLGDDLAVVAELVRSLAEHVVLDGLEKSRDVLAEVGDGDFALAGGELVTAGDGDDVLGAVLGAEFDTEGDTLEFPVVELPAGALVVAHVGLGTDTSLEQDFLDGVGLGVVLLAILSGGLCGDANGDNDGLDLGDAGRDNQTLVVPGGENHDTDGTGGKTP
jgi:hypothetical protein